MKRRDFLKLSSYLSATSAAGLLPQLTFAQSSNYAGPYVLTIEAQGGWDPTSFCDPKGSDVGSDEILNNYKKADIGKVGNLSYAPPAPVHAGNNSLYSYKSFLESHYRRLLVVNGLDMKTNAHEAGRNYSWTGDQAQERNPNIAALMAGVNGSDKIMPFMTLGGTSPTMGVVSPTNINGNLINAIKEVAYNEYVNVRNPDERYFADNVASMVADAQASRQLRLLEEQRLMKVRQSLEKFISAANPDTSTLKAFVNNLETSAVTAKADFNDRNDPFNLYRNGRTALAAFETNAAVSAHLRLGTFDTHDNHDERHYPKLVDYFRAVDEIIAEAGRRGLADRLVIIMQSDFGRTNKYNNDAGKDHWPITSALYWGAPKYFTGNRVIGATDKNHKALEVDPDTLALNSNGIRIEPSHLHHGLRDLLGVSNSAITNSFNIPGRRLNIFS